MQAIATIGLDIAKSVFQMYEVDAEGNVILCRQLKLRYGVAFFPEATQASSVSKLAPLRIVGRAARGAWTRRRRAGRTNF